MMVVFKKVPWDILVFFFIIITGFGFAIEKMLSPNDAAIDRLVVQSDEKDIDSSKNAYQPPASVIDLGCLENSQSREQHVASLDGVIRVKGKLCLGAKNARPLVDGIKVKNKTNGYQGTIFVVGNSSFVSDFLVLQTGRNLIEVVWSSLGGKKQSVSAEVYQR